MPELISHISLETSETVPDGATPLSDMDQSLAVSAVPDRGTQRPLTILTIDDVEVITELIEAALTQHGHAVLTACSGEEGIELFKDNLVDVVICDLVMPGISGWEVGNRIKAMCVERKVRKTPFVLLTAWATQCTDPLKIARSGVDAVVEKPVQITKLLGILNDVLIRST